MRDMKWHPLIVVVVVFAGCGVRHTPSVVRRDVSPVNDAFQFSLFARNAEQFQFIRGGMPMTAVIHRVGWPDRELGSGQLRWEYDLVDGSELVILPVVRDYTNLATWQVAWFGQRRGTNWVWTKPADYK